MGSAQWLRCISVPQIVETPIRRRLGSSEFNAAWGSDLIRPSFLVALRLLQYVYRCTLMRDLPVTRPSSEKGIRDVELSTSTTFEGRTTEKTEEKNPEVRDQQAHG